MINSSGEYQLRLFKTIAIAEADSSHASRLFICAEVNRTDGKPLMLNEGSMRSTTSAYNKTYYVEPFSGSYQPQSTVGYQQLFLIDAFDHFNDTVSFSFKYGLSVWASFENVILSRNLESLSIDQQGVQVPRADSAWAVSLLRFRSIPTKLK